MIGQTIDGEYKIVRLLGTGAFGSVYEAEEVSLKRPVAVKMLKAADGGDKQLQRFLNEAQLLARLNHENVVRIIRLGKHEGAPYLVMEYLTGRTLGSIMDEGVSMKRAVGILQQICRGLHAIHELGVVHRDLSRNNIMVTAGGDAKILDLGLAKDLNHEAYTHGQYLAGTIWYVSPEQIAGRGATPASDIFAFGVICYELLTGSNPFRAEHHMQVLYNIGHRDPEPLDVHLPTCPPTLARIVTQCIEKQPEDRPNNLQEVEQVLAGVAEGLTTETTAGTTLGATIEMPKAMLQVTSRNPYLNRVMIKRRDDFFGRAQEVRRIYARLNAIPPGSVSVVGDRKIGKSSLLNFIYNRQNRNEQLEQPEKMVMVFLDLQQQKNMTLENFVKVLLGMAGYELRGRLEIGDCSLDLDGVRDMVQRLDSNGYRLCIILDEFEAITANPNFDLEFFSFLRYLANHYNVAYLTSSARHLQSLCHNQEISDSPFFNIFSALRLSAFRPSEAEDLIRVPSERVEKPLAEYTDRIIEVAGLFPFFIQIACSHCLEYIDENPDQALDFAEIRTRFYDEARLHYQYMWTAFDSHERSAIVRIARGKSIPDALKHVLGELSTRHYVETEDSIPRLFSATFQDFVKTSEEGKKKSFLGRILGRG